MLPTHIRGQLGIDAPNRRFDTIIHGRVTYDTALAIGVTSPYAHLREYVASTTLVDSVDPHVTVVADPVAAIRALKQEDGLGIYLAGGGRLAGALRDEVDHLIVKVYPVLAGTGVSMFSGEVRPTSFELTDQHTFTSGTAVMTYRRI